MERRETNCDRNYSKTCCSLTCLELKSRLIEFSQVQHASIWVILCPYKTKRHYFCMCVASLNCLPAQLYNLFLIRSLAPKACVCGDVKIFIYIKLQKCLWVLFKRTEYNILEFFEEKIEQIIVSFLFLVGDLINPECFNDSLRGALSQNTRDMTWFIEELFIWVIELNIHQHSLVQVFYCFFIVNKLL